MPILVLGLELICESVLSETFHEWRLAKTVCVCVCLRKEGKVSAEKEKLIFMHGSKTVKLNAEYSLSL